MRKYIVRAAIGILGAILLFLIGLILFLTITEYNPADRQAAEMIFVDENGGAAGTSLTVCSWNIGYAGLGWESDFFMEGGKMVDPPGPDAVKKNIAGIQSYIQSNGADVWLFQEVDINSSRSGSTNLLERLRDVIGGSAAFAYNYKCPFVPIPIPPIGRVESGLATLTHLKIGSDAERISLPCPFSWPMRTANLKRCLLVTRIAVEGTDRELVLINLHMEAYDDGDGRVAQTKLAVEFMRSEFEKGNYVIAGGDFNQAFPEMLDKFPITNPKLWTPGVLEEDSLPDGWRFAYDPDAATCRSLCQPYSEGTQLYAIDGFILSPNVRLDGVEVDELNFEYADHNPVRIKVTLLP